MTNHNLNYLLKVIDYERARANAAEESVRNHHLNPCETCIACETERDQAIGLLIVIDAVGIDNTIISAIKTLLKPYHH